MFEDEFFIKRCFELALLGAGNVAPNPMVGAVIVHEGVIIGEGYHTKDGTPHAEVNAVASVRTENRSLIPYSTMYVSLEPCSFFGRTPPCTNLIIKEGLKKVVISYFDNTPQVNGNGIKQLKNAGIEVKTNVLKKEGKDLFKIRETNLRFERPYIILKYAQTQDGFFSPANKEQFWISNSYSKRLVHKWRAEVDAILVGTNTAIIDNPKLDTRLYFGSSPTRVVLDRTLKIPKTHHIFQGDVPTLVFTAQEGKVASNPNVEFIAVNFGENLIFDLLKHLYLKKISSLLVEGGAQVLESFIKQNLWDEARVFRGNQHLKQGRTAPVLSTKPYQRIKIDNDELLLYHNEC